MNYTDFRCGQSFHVFARDGEDHVQAFHSDNSVCGSAEFSIAELLEDDLPRLVECPYCMIKTLDKNHILRCSGYKPAPTANEIRDAYSDPTEHAKRDRLLWDPRRSGAGI